MVPHPKNSSFRQQSIYDGTPCLGALAGSHKKQESPSPGHPNRMVQVLLGLVSCGAASVLHFYKILKD